MRRQTRAPLTCTVAVDGVTGERKVTNRGEPLDLDAVVLDAAAYFESPMAVVRDSRLTREQKVRVLESWVRDAQLLSQAEAENMPGADRPRLQEAKLALREAQKAG